MSQPTRPLKAGKEASEASVSSVESTDTAIRVPQYHHQEASTSTTKSIASRTAVPPASPTLSAKPTRNQLDLGVNPAVSPIRRALSVSRPALTTRQSSHSRFKGKGRAKKDGSESSDTDVLSDGSVSARSRREEDPSVLVPGNSDDEVKPLDRGEQLIRRRNKARKMEQKRLAAAVARQHQLASQHKSKRDAPSPTPAHPQDGDTDTEFNTTEQGELSGRQVHSRRTTIESDSSAPLSPIRHSTDASTERTSRPTAWLSTPNTNTRRVSYVPMTRDHESSKTEASASSNDEGSGDEEQQQLLRGGPSGEEEDSDGEFNDDDDVEYTLKDRQDAINIEHPFGLPIWKPALYKKSRSVTRHAEDALHLAPSSAAERHLLPGNILWTLLFGIVLALVCFVLSAILWCIPWGGSKYGRVVFELGGYFFWPFGRYVEGWDPDGSVFGTAPVPEAEKGAEGHEGIYDSDDESFDVEAWGHSPGKRDSASEESSKGTVKPEQANGPSEQSLLNDSLVHARDYGATASGSGSATLASPDGLMGKDDPDTRAFNYEDSFRIRALGRLSYWAAFYLIIAPLMLLVCLTCWATVFPIPMARLLWRLVGFLAREPLALHFRSAPTYHPPPDATMDDVRPPPLKAGQLAPKHSAKVYARDRGAGRLIGPGSKILLCAYEAMGWRYYKYTVDGVNIIFINLLPVVFFVLLDFFFIRDRVPADATGFLAFIASPIFLFVLSLASVIPLSYFIGMAVASISAQSSIGMGAVINATFGSIIEVILYSIALVQSKAVLVEGSIVGSLLAGVLLMPGLSMVSGAFRRKEQKFNARSAGVTSTMLIMAIIGTLTPTLFYEIYGTFQLTCSGCPVDRMPGETWTCSRCAYTHIDPVDDPFFKSTVQYLSYHCAIILVLSYLVGLWFSLRTHASQIWQNEKALPVSAPQSAATHATFQKKANLDSLHKLASSLQKDPQASRPASVGTHTALASPTVPYKTTTGRDSPILTAEQVSYFKTAIEEMRDYQAQREASVGPDGSFLHAGVAIRRQPSHVSHTHNRDASQPFVVPVAEQGHGGHDAPTWSRTKSASVLVLCTILYAAIAEVLVDLVDAVLNGSSIPEKFLGITLFALVPNTTEFMNAISFALNGNIALSMEIGSAYALQVCLLQIPAMVAFTYFYGIGKTSMYHHAFTLVFPRWDVIAILFSVFLLTYVYLEARANYYRGSILIFSYLVLMAGFYYSPSNVDTEDNPALTFLKVQDFTPSLMESISTNFNSLWSR